MRISNGLNKKFIIIIILILAVGGGYFAFKKYLPTVPSPSPEPSATASPASSLDPKVEEYQKYLMEGMNYRLAGMQGDKDAFYKAIESYKKAADLGEGKVWIPYLNLGNTYTLVQDYKKAEDSYNTALEIAPGESTIYLQKIDLYRNKNSM